MAPICCDATRGFRAAGSALLAAALGCSSFEGGEDRLPLDSERVISQAQPDRWWCLGDDPIAREATRAGTANSQVTLRLPLHDQFTQMAPTTPLEGRLCAATDLGCTRPIVDWIAVPPDGRLTALVPAGFSGYAEIRGSGYPDSLFVIDVPVLRDLDLYSHPLVPIEGLVAIGAALMQPVLRENEGLLGTAVLDCDGVATEGVRVELSSAAEPFVLVSGVPVAGSNVTAADGGVILNRITPGPSIVSATLTDGRKLREQALDIRGGWFTVAYLRPIIYSADEICAIGSGNPVPGRLEALGRVRPCQTREELGAAQ